MHVGQLLSESTSIDGPHFAGFSGQCFSHFSIHQNYVQDLLKHRLLGPVLRVSDFDTYKA